MDENEITQRLRAAGDQPVPGEVRAGHLSRMHAAVPVADAPKRFGRFAVAAAAFVGFAVGSTGFAMAGALPDPAQQVAHDVLSVVQVDVHDPKDNHGQCVSKAMKAMDPALSEEARKAAKDEACPKEKGKPAHAGKGKGRPAHAGTPGGPKGDTHADDPCKGRPAWAGKGGKDLTEAEREALRNERATQCGRDLESDDEQQDAAEPEDQAGQDQAPGAEQRQADPGGEAPAETPPGPPADGAPGQQDDATTPPVEVPTSDRPTTDSGAG